MVGIWNPIQTNTIPQRIGSYVAWRNRILRAALHWGAARHLDERTSTVMASMSIVACVMLLLSASGAPAGFAGTGRSFHMSYCIRLLVKVKYPF